MYSRIKTIDRKSRNARVWSNRELQKVAPLFRGDVCNISAWNDEDKEGYYYRDYFLNAKSYQITNYHNSDARGSQGNLSDEIILDLTSELSPDLIDKFDAVFNHTTLEHIFDCNKAISNICRTTRDIVILVVPFLQETHGSYGDYWRFTPQGIDMALKANGLETIYLNYNEQSRDSIYIFAIGSKNPSKWSEIKELKDNKLSHIYSTHIGKQIIKNSLIDRLMNFLYKLFMIPSRKI